MKDFLKKIRLIENFTLVLPLPVDNFVSGLDAVVSEEAHDFLSLSDHNFAGKVDHKGFRLTRSLPLPREHTLVTAKGTFSGQHNETLAHTEIIGFDNFARIFCFSLLFFMVVLLSSALFADNAISNSGAALLGNVIVILFLLLTSYFSMRKCMKSMKRDLEIEFLMIAENKKEERYETKP